MSAKKSTQESLSISESINLADPFADLDQLKISAGDADTLGVRRALLQIPVRKPGRQDWFRVHRDESYRLDTAVIELKDEREIYLVAPHMRDAVLGETKFVRLLLAMTRQGVVFLIPVGMPDLDGRTNTWHQSIMQTCELAMRTWVRCSANMSLGGYDTFEAGGNIPEPDWPDKPLTELLRIAFRDRLIDTESHPVIRQLFGQA